MGRLRRILEALGLARPREVVLAESKRQLERACIAAGTTRKVANRIVSFYFRGLPRDISAATENNHSVELRDGKSQLGLEPQRWDVARTSQAMAATILPRPRTNGKLAAPEQRARRPQPSTSAAAAARVPRGAASPTPTKHERTSL